MDIKLDTICRVCLINSQELINIFNDNLAQYIMNFALVKININDGLPQSICKLCADELKIAIQFKDKCEKSQIKLYEYINSYITTDSTVVTNNEDLYSYQSSFKMNDKSNLEVYDDVSSIIQVSKESTSNDKFYKIESQEQLLDNKTNIDSSYECTSCEKQNLTLTDFQQHVCPIKITKINQPNLENNIKNQTNTNPSRKIHQCEFCGKITNGRAGLLRHMTLHTNERPYKCDTCGKTFRLRAFLTKHLLTHAGIRTHHCLFCTKSFVQKSSLSSHMKTHSGEKKFTCNICNKIFRYSRSLNYHLKLHTGERNFPCSQCNKAFVNPFDLRRHVKLHDKYKAIKEGTYDKSQERPKQIHQCENCGKCFPSRGDLTKHFRVHSGVRPFKCQYCGKGLISSSALTVHVRTHTGSKPYRCQHCNQSFAQSSNLKVHVRLHTGDRPYICTLCNKGYNRKRDLDTHVKKHAIADKT